MGLPEAGRPDRELPAGDGVAQLRRPGQLLGAQHRTRRPARPPDRDRPGRASTGPGCRAGCRVRRRWATSTTSPRSSTATSSSARPGQSRLQRVGVAHPGRADRAVARAAPRCASGARAAPARRPARPRTAPGAASPAPSPCRPAAAPSPAAPARPAGSAARPPRRPSGHAGPGSATCWKSQPPQPPGWAYGQGAADPVRRGVPDLDGVGPAERAAAVLGHLGQHRLTGQRVPQEHHPALVAGHAVPAVRDRADQHLEPATQPALGRPVSRLPPRAGSPGQPRQPAGRPRCSLAACAGQHRGRRSV